MELPPRRGAIFAGNWHLRLLRFYLNGAYEAGYDRVLVQGVHVGNDCDPNQLGWVIYSVFNLLRDQNEVLTLYNAATRQHLPGEWYFCDYAH